MRALSRVLVRLPNWLGDALMARPALHALRGAHPRAEIVALGPAPLLELLEADGLWNRAEAWPSAPAGRRAPARGCDAALVLPPSFSSAWHALRAGAALRVGFAHEGRSPLLTRAVRRPARGDLHLSREYLMLAAALGAHEVEVGLLPLARGADGEVRGQLAELGIGAERFVVLAPGAAYGPAKRWSAERFGALGRWLSGRGLRVLVCGSEGERATCEAVAREVGGGAQSLAGRTRLPVQAGLCARAALTVSNDSGLAHLAAAVGGATIVVFGSTSSSWTAPLGPRVRVVQRAPVCAPCFARTCAIGYPCLGAVEVEMVAQAALEFAA